MPIISAEKNPPRILIDEKAIADRNFFDGKRVNSLFKATTGVQIISSLLTQSAKASQTRIQKAMQSILTVNFLIRDEVEAVIGKLSSDRCRVAVIEDCQVSRDIVFHFLTGLEDNIAVRKGLFRRTFGEDVISCDY